MNSSVGPSHQIGGPCIFTREEARICGVPRYLCGDCHGDRYVFPCDMFENAIGIDPPNCLQCVNHEADLEAAVHGSRLPACMVEPCRFERRVQ